MISLKETAFKKDVLVLFIIAFSVRLLFSVIVLERVGQEAFEPRRRDADTTQYIELAKSILRDHSFTLYGVPHSFRTPGYPAWLAVWYWLSGSWFFAVGVVGSLLGGITASATYFLGRKIFSRNVALGAGYLFALEPYGVHMSLRPMTEALYALLVVMFGFCLVSIFNNNNHRSVAAFVAGIFIGLAVLVRPQMWPFYIGIAAILFFLLLKRRVGSWYAFQISLLFCCGTVLIVLPWIVRNGVLFHEYDISSQGGWNLYLYHVKRFSAQDRYFGQSENELLRYLQRERGGDTPADIRSIAYQPIFYRDAFNIIRAHPFSYPLWHLKESLIFFHDDGLRDALRHFQPTGYAGNYQPSYTKFEYLVLITFVILGVFSWVSIFVLGMVAFLAAIQSYLLRPIVIFFVATVIYVPAVAGTLAVARFRFPMTPIIFLLACFGMEFLLKSYKMRKTHI